MNEKLLKKIQKKFEPTIVSFLRKEGFIQERKQIKIEWKKLND